MWVSIQWWPYWQEPGKTSDPEGTFSAQCLGDTLNRKEALPSKAALLLYQEELLHFCVVGGMWRWEGVEWEGEREWVCVCSWTKIVSLKTYLYAFTKLAASSSCLRVTRAFAGFVVSKKWRTLPPYVDWSYLGFERSILGSDTSCRELLESWSPGFVDDIAFEDCTSCGNDRLQVPHHGHTPRIRGVAWLTRAIQDPVPMPDFAFCSD